jgi:hypothetical protein
LPDAVRHLLGDMNLVQINVGDEDLIPLRIVCLSKQVPYGREDSGKAAAGEVLTVDQLRNGVYIWSPLTYRAHKLRPRLRDYPGTHQAERSTFRRKHAIENIPTATRGADQYLCFRWA